MCFGKRLRDLRVHRGLSQEELGKILSLDKSTISLYESGKREPAQDTLQQIADYFKVSLDYLMGRTDQPITGPLPNWVTQLSPEIREFLQKEAETGSPYLNLLKDARLSGLPPESIEQIIHALMTARKLNRDTRPSK